jgi:ribosomal protein L25 (general stress protein Ctc)
MVNYGFVYILSNAAMPGIYKIGYTDRAPSQRADELSRSTSVPMAFEVVVYGEVDEAQSVERDFHEMYQEYRLSGNREFFRFSLDQLIREVCINLKEYSLHFTYCHAYDHLDFERDFEEQQEIEAAKSKGFMPFLLEQK